MPVPATVEMLPSGVTLRTRLLVVSAMYMLPSGPKAKPSGLFSWAAVARPPSPPKPPCPPVPATMVTTPVVGVHLRITALPVSAK